MRAVAAQGRDVFGYNRSVEGAQGAIADGFDATTDLTDALTRAADTSALIVLAVPMPALPGTANPIRRAFQAYFAGHGESRASRKGAKTS